MQVLFPWRLQAPPERNLTKNFQSLVAPQEIFHTAWICHASFATQKPRLDFSCSYCIYQYTLDIYSRNTCWRLETYRSGDKAVISGVTTVSIQNKGLVYTIPLSFGWFSEREIRYLNRHFIVKEMGFSTIKGNLHWQYDFSKKWVVILIWSS